MLISQIEEMKKCYEDFSHFTSKYINIFHPTRGLIGFDLLPFQKRLWEDYDKYRYVITTKFRKAGFSTLTCMWALYQCMFKESQNIFIGCNSKAEARCIHDRIINPAVQMMPEWMKPRLGYNNWHHMEFKGSNSNLRFGILDAARGVQVNALIIDEAAFIKNMEDHWKMIYPCLHEGRCFVVSTTNGIGNWFHKTYLNAIEGKNNFHVFRAEYTEHPEWQAEKNIDQIKYNLGAEGWCQEVLQDFLVNYDKEDQSDSTQSPSEVTVCTNEVPSGKSVILTS